MGCRELRSEATGPKLQNEKILVSSCVVPCHDVKCGMMMVVVSPLASLLTVATKLVYEYICSLYNLSSFCMGKEV